eukprot:1061318-Ditylum_brightwellii.AAC.1
MPASTPPQDLPQPAQPTQPIIAMTLLQLQQHFSHQLQVLPPTDPHNPFATPVMPAFLSPSALPPDDTLVTRYVPTPSQALLDTAPPPAASIPTIAMMSPSNLFHQVLAAASIPLAQPCPTEETLVLIPMQVDAA